MRQRSWLHPIRHQEPEDSAPAPAGSEASELPHADRHAAGREEADAGGARGTGTSTSLDHVLRRAAEARDQLDEDARGDHDA